MKGFSWNLVLCAGICIISIIQQPDSFAGDLPVPSKGNDTQTIDVDSKYVIGSGDVLDISVWKEPALTKLVIVLPDGNISFPLIGEVKAEGLTLKQLKQTIEKKIRRFVPQPNLSVAVREVKSLYIYVIGKVNNPGRYGFKTDLTVLQALAMAGGLNPFAKKNKIKIFRESQQKTQIFEFRYGEVIEGKHLDQNIRLVRGDVIVVP